MNEKNEGGEREDLLMRLRCAAGQVAHEYPVTHRAITDAIAALSPSEQPEPVAWRWRMVGAGLVGMWHYRATRYWGKERSPPEGAEIQPLYAQPSEQTGGGSEQKFQIGDRVTKTKGSSWTGHVVGTYSTTLTPEGYAVESENETGSVQIYPAAALSTPDVGKP